MIDECKKFKNNFLQKLKSDFKQIECQFENYAKVLSTHDTNTNYEMTQLKENIYACQSFVKKIQNFDSNFSTSLKKCSFVPNDWFPDFSIIGNVQQNAHFNFDAAKVSNLEIYSFENTVKSMNRIFNLKNQSLLLTSSDDNTIVQLDEKFNELRRISSIQQHKFNTPLSLCTDGYENIYICDLGNNCVIVTDNEFSRLKRIIGKNKNLILYNCSKLL